MTSRRLVLALLALLLVAPSRPETLVVDDDGTAPFQTIQSAIDAAVDLVDDVYVRCGYYAENVVLASSVDVIGEGAHCTTIDGQGLDYTVTLDFVMSQRRFRAAYDFLLLREQAGEDCGGLGAVWTQMQEDHGPIEVKESPRERDSRRPPRRRRRGGRRRSAES